MGATLIQPQVPLGLPCYDLKTIAYLHLGDALSPSVPEAPASAPTPQGEGWPAPRPESSRPPLFPFGAEGEEGRGRPWATAPRPPEREPGWPPGLVGGRCARIHEGLLSALDGR